MDNYKRILFPIDDKNISLDYAIEFAKDSNARLIILYVYRLNDQAMDDEGNNQLSRKKRIEKALEIGFNEHNLKTLSNAKIDYEVHYELGFLSDRLKVSLRENKIDVLLLNPQNSYDENLTREETDRMDVTIQMVPTEA